MAEKLVCPRNPRWLKAVYDYLGEELFRKSKLGKYLPCLKEAEEEKKKGE